MTEDDATAPDDDPTGEASAGVDGDAGTATVAEDRDAESAEGAAPPDRPLHERVAEYDEALAAEVESVQVRKQELAMELDEAEAEIEDLSDRLKRTQADFQNYKKRTKRQQEQFRERATEDLVERLLDVHDNLQRALDQEGDAGIREGVEATLRAFDDVLADENVEQIAPDPGSEVDPERHEVLTRVAADVDPGTVADVYRPGYEMAGKVVRPAQVTVAEE